MTIGKAEAEAEANTFKVKTSLLIIKIFYGTRYWCLSVCLLQAFSAQLNISQYGL
jgi:hypothetical protein